MVGHNPLDEAVFLFQCHMADVMPKVALSADVNGLATAVTSLHDRFEGLSVVNLGLAHVADLTSSWNASHPTESCLCPWN
jgi:hypothetical protein